MKISLITVCYNSAATIRGAMESVALQEVERKGGGGERIGIEYIVVDGGSTDGTVDIIREFEKKVLCLGSQVSSLASDASRPRPTLGSNLDFRWLSEKDRGMYDAMNKGIAMATGDVIGLLNADDVLSEDDTLAKVAVAFGDLAIDGIHADIRFVRDAGWRGDEVLGQIRSAKTVRYCSGKRFRPWMFRFGTQTAHPSTFFRKECFARWGAYSLDFGMYGDFELLCRFIWKRRARMRYLPLCTTVMRMGGASTNGWRTTLKINRADLRALRANGCWSCLPFLYVRYLFKVWGFVFKTGRRPVCFMI